MIKNTEIKLGKGLDTIKFGFSTAKVEDILGEPDYIDRFETEDEEKIITYFYYELGIDLIFESIDNYRLSAISIVNPEFHYKNELKVGISKEEVFLAAKNLGLSQPEDEGLVSNEFPNHTLISFEKENLDIWLDDNIVSEIEFGPFWKDENTFLWADE